MSIASSVPTIAYGAITPSSPIITARSPSATMIPIPSVEEDHYDGHTNHDDTSVHSMDLFQLSSAAAASHHNRASSGGGSGHGHDRTDTLFGIPLSYHHIGVCGRIHMMLIMTRVVHNSNRYQIKRRLNASSITSITISIES